MSITADPTSINAEQLSRALPELQTTLAGRLITRTDADFLPSATPWNVAVTTLPVAVVQATNAADVAATLRWAARFGIDVAVRNTGHGAVAFDRPTILISTQLLDEVTIDPDARTARVGAGVRWAQVLDAAAVHGLGALAGSAPGVGVVGYLTGGGLSPIGRGHGFGSDLVTAFDVVTGDGHLRRATAQQNPALFWGLCGGKGALGVVTAVEFDLFDAPGIVGGCLFFDGADAAAVSRVWTDWSAALPESVCTSIAYLRLPALPTVPPPLAGRLTVAVRFAVIGDEQDLHVAEQQLDPVRTAAPVILGGVGPMPFAALGAIHADPVEPMPTFETSALLSDYPPEAAATLLKIAGPDADCPFTVVEIRRMGGAYARAPRTASAVSHRDAAVNVFAVGLAIPPLEQANTACSVQFNALLRPWTVGAQINFNTTADPQTVARSYEPAVLTRLAELSAAYDPHAVLTAARPLRQASLTRS